MRISPDQIAPSQDFLKAKTVGFIIECIRNGELDKLPPDPIVRKDDEGNLVAIDGHNLIAVKLHRNEDVNVHIALSADDGLPANSEANLQRNQDLKDKYDTVLVERDRLREEGISSFSDLMDRYPGLF